MKVKTIIGCLLVVAMLMVASPALASLGVSLGVSPPSVELEVPGNGSVTANVKVHYFSGDVNISLVDIPLRVEPETIHVEATSEPVTVELTIYGDDTLGSQVYDGFILLIAMSGGAATGAVQIIAQISNIVEGVTPVKAPVVEESTPVVEEPTPETALPEPVAEEPAPITPPPGPPQSASSPEGQIKYIPLLWAVAGTVVGAVLIAIFAIGSRRMKWSKRSF